MLYFFQYVCEEFSWLSSEFICVSLSVAGFAFEDSALCKRFVLL